MGVVDTEVIVKYFCIFNFKIVPDVKTLKKRQCQSKKTFQMLSLLIIQSNS